MTYALPHNLRSSVTRLVGRKIELAELAELIAGQRLVTIAGPGGSGKTRLAAEVSDRIVHALADPPAGAEELRWLDLGCATDASDVVHACARSLGVRLEGDGRDPTAALVAGLGHRRVIMVFDTCEHLLVPIADLIERILEGCPGVSVLATSREPLGIVGEAVWRIPILNDRDAAELFTERARLVAHDAGLSPHDPLIMAICHRLDGLPLAIEIVSAWMRVFTAAQILAWLDERLRVLTGGLRRGISRHRTLEASIGWSHDLLSPAERYVFGHLSVFVGEFDVSAVEEVCPDVSDADESTLGILARLADKSLLITDRNGDQAHFRLLTTVRDYAADRLVEAGEVAEARDRHLSWCLRTMDAVDESLGHDQDSALRLFDEIEANVTAALDWALQAGDEGRRRGRRLAHLAVLPWFYRSHGHRGRLFLDRAIAAPVEPDDGMHHLLASDAALLGIMSGRPRSESEPPDDGDCRTEDRLAVARFGLIDAFDVCFTDHEAGERRGIDASARGSEVGDPLVEDFALIMAAYSLTARERHDHACQLATPAAARARARGDRFCWAFALGVEQYGLMQTGRLADAVRLGREMVELITPLGNPFGVGSLTGNLALALCLAGDIDGARRIMLPIIGALDSAADIDVVALPVPMGRICLRAGEWEEAARWFRRGVARLEHGPPDWTAANCLPGLVEALRRLGHTAEAVDVADCGQELDITAPEFVANLTEQRAFLLPPDEPLARTLHRRALDIRVRAGMRTFIPDSLDALARHQAHDHPADAVRLLAVSTAARDTMAYPRPLANREEHDALLTELRGALSRDTYDDSHRAGAAMCLDEGIELAQGGRRRPKRPETGWASLTPAELGVVRLLAQGLTNVDIAGQLVVSRATVKTHVYHVFAKLGVTTRTELAAIAHAQQVSSSPERSGLDSSALRMRNIPSITTDRGEKRTAT